MVRSLSVQTSLSFLVPPARSVRSWGATFTILLAFSRCVAAAESVVLENAQEHQGGYSLAAGPKVEGVVLLQQGDWSSEVVRAFHDVPWIDAASIRLRWAELEPRDQQFHWAPFDKLLDEVKKHNAAHPQTRRTLQIRVMGGVHCPKWFEHSGVKYYDTTQPGHVGGKVRISPLRIPMPYDNPEFLKQLREVYGAMYDRYRDEPLVTVYHGTWSAGPWDEIFHPQGDAPLPPGYTAEKFVQGMTAQLDVLLEEFCLKGKVAELPYSGKYPPKNQIDVTGPLTARIVQRLGRRSPYLYIQSNGWGMTNTGVQTVSWGHERDIQEALGQVNLALQALGTNAGRGWFPQGDWVGLVELAKKYEAAYVELYPPDFMPLDTRHRIVQAFLQTAETAGSTGADAVPDFVGLRPWLSSRNRVLYVREGLVRATFHGGPRPRRMDSLRLAASVPAHTSVTYRARTRPAGGAWSAWQDENHVSELPPATEAEIEATLHTDDGWATPTITQIRPVWK